MGKKTRELLGLAVVRARSGVWSAAHRVAVDAPWIDGHQRLGVVVPSDRRCSFHDLVGV